jgi:hypothetical protein
LPGEALVAWDDALARRPDDLELALLFADRAEALDVPLLGAVALAPFGDRAGERIAELLVQGGETDAGIASIRRALALRRVVREHEARVRAGATPRIPSI